MTPYLRELGENWRPLAAALIGMGGGLMMAAYVMGIMAPYLIAEFGWERSQFALISGLGLVSVISFPIVGRLTDIIGVRRMAAVGAIASPLLFLALSQLHDIRTYAIFFALQCLILVTTTPPIYCRVVVQYVKRARGLALGIVTSGPALTIAIGGPLLNDFVAANGWRAGYLALVGFTIVVGLAAVLLLPPERKSTLVAAKPKAAKEDYAKMLRSRAFWIILIAQMLVSFPQGMMMTQLSMILSEDGVSGEAASAIISLFASGMLVARFVAGVALDRFPAPIVATFGGVLSAIGLTIFASGLDDRVMLMLAAVLVGATAGAEGDVVAYLVARNFGVRIYSSVAGIVASSTAVAAAICAILLSLMLASFKSFVPFLVLTAVLVTIGSILFLFLPFNPTVEDKVEENAEDDARRSLKDGEAAVAQAPVG